LSDPNDKAAAELSLEFKTLSEEVAALRRALEENRIKLEKARIELSEKDIVLDALAKNVDLIKFNTQQALAKRLKSEVIPHLEEIKNEKKIEKICSIAELILMKIRMLIPAASNPYSSLFMLTPMEIRIASMIKDGHKNKEIARMQNISLDTVKTHRRSIRGKLGLTNKDIDLVAYLQSIFT